MAAVRQIMEYVETTTHLDVVAIADHDQVGGALEAVEWCAGRPHCRVQAIVATEISAAWGRHVLGLFCAEPFPTKPFSRFRSLGRTVSEVHDAGGLVVVPHPLSHFVPSIGERTLASLLARPGEVTALRAAQGVEVCSGVVGGRKAEARLRSLNDTAWRLASLGSSDAHHLAQIGSAFTRFLGRTPADLHAAILNRATEAHWGTPPYVPLATHLRQNWRSLIVKPARELRQALRNRAR